MKFILTILLSCLLTSSIAFSKIDPTFDRVAARKQMLALIAVDRPQKVELQGLEKATPEQRTFVEFFRDKVWPKLQYLKQLSVKAQVLQVAGDRALYDSPKEQKEWSEKLVSLTNEMNDISNGQEFKDLIKEWTRLSNGLKGELAEFARNSWFDIEATAFDDKMLPSLARLTTLEEETNTLANTIPTAAKRTAAEQEIDNAKAEFHAGNISFLEATQKIEQSEINGDLAFGKELSEKAGSQLNEEAVLRTKLAQSKGYKNWAEYKLAQSNRFYGESIRSVEGQIAFLEEFLRRTEPAFRNFINERAKEINGATASSWRPAQIDNLLGLPSDSLVRQHFPRELGEQAWRQAMLESGFPAEKLGLVVLDSLPRIGKMGHGGYEAPVASHAPKIVQIGATDLSVKTGQDTIDNFYNAAIYIVQNLRIDGPEGYVTAYHEGGHALHAIHEINSFDESEAYGYVEIHSTTMEHFWIDIEHLVRAAKTRDGKTMTRALAERFVRNSELNGLIQLRLIVSRALFDLRLWSQQYTEPSSKKYDPSDKDGYVQKSKRLWAEVFKSSLLYGLDPAPAYDWSFYSFVRPHFRSGWVIYSGYVFAAAGADLVYNSILDRLEKATGRRTLDRQPTLASTLIPFYRDGFRKPFPESVENFTGSKFSLEGFASHAAKAAGEYRAGK